MSLNEIHNGAHFYWVPIHYQLKLQRKPNQTKHTWTIQDLLSFERKKKKEKKEYFQMKMYVPHQFDHEN